MRVSVSGALLLLLDHDKEMKKEREKNRSMRQARRDSLREKQVRLLNKLCVAQDQKTTLTGIW